MTDQTRLYGVSFGNGNDGVSHIFYNFAVRTSDPFKLAEESILSEIREKYRDWARDAVHVDGEADYTIYATLFEGPDGETEFGAAWLCCEVFPLDEDDVRPNQPLYESLEECFG